MAELLSLQKQSGHGVSRKRTVKNVDEFVVLLGKFPQWPDKSRDYRRWYNRHRFHRGIGTQPAKLSPALIRREPTLPKHSASPAGGISTLEESIIFAGKEGKDHC
ncbi:MAG: hypothetical protein H5T49_05835 [Hadesarchaea archaeon]|nr:hypothetical protein [Hadesarchaea archaeon]